MGVMYPLASDGVFWTVQGEGALLGEPMVFVRFAGCSVGCPECDTDYRVRMRVDLETLVKHIQAAVPKPVNSTFVPWVWLTGGEPTDHNIRALVDALLTIGFKVALATSGGRRVTGWGLSWISVSPHVVPERLVQTTGHELKIVPGLNGLDWPDVETFGRFAFPYRYLQPVWFRAGEDEDGSRMDAYTRRCVEFVTSHPGWRMGVQAHRVWGVA